MQPMMLARATCTKLTRLIKANKHVVFGWIALACIFTAWPRCHRVHAPPPITVAQAESRVDVEIHIIANNRLPSLRRLLASLSACGFDTQQTPLVFHIEAEQKQKVLHEAETYHWQNKHIAARLTKGGLINAVSEAWQPARLRSASFALLLEDDIVLAKSCSSYVLKMAALCAGDDACAGFSLYTPRVDELDNQHMRKSRISLLEVMQQRQNHYRQQLPCSWGAAYKATHWATFRKYIAARLQRTKKYRLQVPLGAVVGWSASWKKFMLELMLLHGWYLFYPNLPNQASISTNMLEPGEHIKKTNDVHKKEAYTVPLVTNAGSVAVPAIANQTTLLDSLDSRVESFFHAKPAAEHRSRRPLLRCDNYDARLHKSLFTARNNETTTIVISHMHTDERFAAFGLLVRHYCRMQHVHRVVVVWHSLQHAPPPTSTCPDDGTTLIMFEQFATDSLLNRFAPTELIMTPSFVTLDDDMLVHEDDLRGMLRLWQAEQHKVIGPFVRWVDATGNYAYTYKKAADASYVATLTKFHISSTQLMRKVFCDPQYEYHRRFVDKHKNSEDLLYIKVAIDFFQRGNPSLVYRNKHNVIDFGTVGLHSRAKHNNQRTEALIFFGMLDDSLKVRREADEHNHHRKYKHTEEAVKHLMSVSEYKMQL